MKNLPFLIEPMSRAQGTLLVGCKRWLPLLVLLLSSVSSGAQPSSQQPSSQQPSSQQSGPQLSDLPGPLMGPPPEFPPAELSPPADGILGNQKRPPQSINKPRQIPPRPSVEVQTSNQPYPDSKLAEKNLAEKNLAEKNLAEKNLAEKNLADKKLSGQKLGDQKLGDQKLGEKKLGEKKLSDSKRPEEPVAQQQPSAGQFHPIQQSGVHRAPRSLELHLPSASQGASPSQPADLAGFPDPAPQPAPLPASQRSVPEAALGQAPPSPKELPQQSDPATRDLPETSKDYLGDSGELNLLGPEEPPVMVPGQRGPTSEQRSTPGYTIRGGDCVLPRCKVVLVEEIRLPAQQPGLIAFQELEVGMSVSADQEVARIEDSQAKGQLRLAEEKLAKAQKQANTTIALRRAQATARLRLAEMNKAISANRRVSGTVPSLDLMRMRSAAEDAKMVVEQARVERELAASEVRLRQVEVQLAKEMVSRHAIRSPLQGVVVEVLRHRGDWVDAGDAVARVLRLDRVHIHGMLNVRDFGPEVAGCLVTVEMVTPQNKTETFAGKLIFVSPEIDPINGDFRVVAEVENRQLLLRPGLSVSMTIHLENASATAEANPQRRLLLQK